MEATCSSETPVDSQRTTERYIPEDRTFECNYSLEAYFFSRGIGPLTCSNSKLISETCRHLDGLNGGGGGGGVI
jgi:hypothetical protein